MGAPELPRADASRGLGELLLMTKSIKMMPERKLRHEGAAGAIAGNVTPTASTDARETQASPSAKRAEGRTFGPDSPVLHALGMALSPLQWWRTLPADEFLAGEYINICSSLDEIADVLEGNDAALALYGHGNAAIGLVLGGMPIRKVGLRGDIAMTAVARCALEGDLRAALVLCHILRHADLDRRRADDLCASWLAYYLRHSPTKRDFTHDEKVILRKLHACDDAAIRDTGCGACQ